MCRKNCKWDFGGGTKHPSGGRGNCPPRLNVATCLVPIENSGYWDTFKKQHVHYLGGFSLENAVRVGITLNYRGDG